jgi:hypothetical protein
MTVSNKPFSEQVADFISKRDIVLESLSVFWKYYTDAKEKAHNTPARHKYSYLYYGRFDDYEIVGDMVNMSCEGSWNIRDLDICFKKSLLDDFEAFKKWTDTTIAEEYEETYSFEARSAMYEEALEIDRALTLVRSLAARD